jgi:hypothetical protein
MGHEKTNKRLARRDVLKLGAAAGLAVPTILTLAPKEARAEGSWSGPTYDFSERYGARDWKSDINQRQNLEDARGQQNRYTIPGTHEWREQRRREEERRRQMRGDFDRFGSSRDW